jgi:AcrR family transcriptional regulator
MAVELNRRDARRESRQRRLIDASLDVLAERGYVDTTVDQIVARARASKTTFYEFFESKEDCVRLLLEREGGGLMQTVHTAAIAGSNPRDRIRRGIRAFVAACAEHRRVARVLLVESVGVSPRIEAVRRLLQGRFAQLVEEDVRAAATSDAFYAGVDPVVFGRAVVGAVGEAMGYFLSQPAGDPEALATEVCRIFAP